MKLKNITGKSMMAMVYELLYLCPVLFYGRHGAVAAQGQVGNQEFVAETALNFALPQNKEEVKEEPKPDETEDKDKESECHENLIIEEDSPGVTKTFFAEESKEQEDEPESKEVDIEINKQKDEFNLSIDKDTVTKISDINMQSGENAEISSSKQNNESNNEGTQKEITETIRKQRNQMKRVSQKNQFSHQKLGQLV